MKKENINKEKGKGNKREKWRIGPLPRIWPMEQLHARGPAREHGADVWDPAVSRGGLLLKPLRGHFSAVTDPRAGQS
jgi:hypothetical protein